MNSISSIRVAAAPPRTPAAPAAPEKKLTFDSFESYWPYYLSKHRQPGTRIMHFCGVAGALSLGVAGLATMNPWLIAAMPVVGYGCARFSHKFIEHGEPAASPLLALRGDAKMFGLMLRGQLWTGDPTQQHPLPGTT